MLEFHVRSVPTLPLEGFLLKFGHIIILVRRCAEPMTQLGRLKVKVTVNKVSK